MMRSMVIDMNDEPLHTLAQMQAFLDGTETIEFSVVVEERDGLIARTVRRFGYARLKRAHKAVVLLADAGGSAVAIAHVGWRGWGLGAYAGAPSCAPAAARRGFTPAAATA